jgi:AAA domain/RepB DNA-primase from phage plasmid
MILLENWPPATRSAGGQSAHGSDFMAVSEYPLVPANASPLAFDPDAARAFLANLDQIHLCAIPAKGGAVIGFDFGVDSDAAIAWAGQQNAAGAGIYWTVNGVSPGCNRKPSKADIISTRFAFVDIDPPKDGRAFDKAAVLTTLQASLAPPSIVIDSGGGLQALWRLFGQPIDLATIEAANTVLRNQWGGDACQNGDRLARLPGSINWPNAKKANLGRIAALSQIVHENSGRFYDHDWVQSLASLAARSVPSAALTPIPSNEVRLETPATLGLPPVHLLTIAVTSPRGNDRSADSLYCAGQAVSHGLSDGQIIGLLLNPDNAISAHCLEQSNPMRAAKRCIARARSGIAPPPPITVISSSSQSGFTFDSDEPPIRAPRWIIKDVLPESGIGFIGGQSGAGKSFLAVDLAVAIATGEGASFFGKAVRRRAGVAIIAAEGAGGLPSRIEAARGHRNAAKGLPIAFAASSGDMMQAGAIESLIAQLRGVGLRFEAEGSGLGVVIIDTLAAAFGLKDENSNAEAAQVMRTLQSIATGLNVIVIAVHHYGKSAETGLRGASAFRAGADFSIAVHAERDGEGKARNRRVAIEKSRDGEEGPIGGFDLNWTALGTDDDGDAFGSCFIEPNNRKPTARKGKPQIALEEAIKAKMGDDRQASMEAVREAFSAAYGATGKDPASATHKAWKRALECLPTGFAISPCGDWICPVSA